VQPLSHLTSCTPTKSNLYFANSLAHRRYVLTISLVRWCVDYRVVMIYWVLGWCSVAGWIEMVTCEVVERESFLGYTYMSSHFWWWWRNNENDGNAGPPFLIIIHRSTVNSMITLLWTLVPCCTVVMHWNHLCWWYVCWYMLRLNL
jgi:hypothetical protein